jgi:NADH dehydrogenase
LDVRDLSGNDGGFDVVTGATGYTGRYLAARLSSQGRRVRTLTFHPDRPAPPGLEVLPYRFDDGAELAASLRGATTLYNTYWMRFGDRRAGADKDTAFDEAVRNSALLFRAAADAGVRRIVHVSVLKPSTTSRYAYFQAKARVEEALAAGPVGWAIVRPALVFGLDAVMLNSLAWVLRRAPVFPIAGRGDYRVRPVFVEDLARLCTEVGDATITDAVGPERPAFVDLVKAVACAVDSRARIVRLPPVAVVTGAAALGRLLGDLLLDKEELYSTMDGLADSEAPTTGATAFSDWVRANGDRLGLQRVNSGASGRR